MSIYRYTRRSLARELLMIGAAALFCAPAYVMITLSLKSQADTYLDPLSLPTSPRFGNYGEAWNEAGRFGLGNAMASSAIITLGSVFCLIILGSLTAYAIARRSGKLETGLFILCVLGYILPFQLAVIPIYVVLRNLGLIGTYPGMVLLYTGLAMPFTVFLYYGFIRTLPKEYEEAAQVDGAGLVRTWLKVVFPLLLPVTGTVAILNALLIWNDFFLALIFLSGTRYETLTVALYSFVGQNASDWHLIMASVAISVLPVLLFYILAQRQLIKGFSGGIRG